MSSLEDRQLLYVRKDGMAIRHIKHPSEKVQLAAARFDEIEFISKDEITIGCTTKSLEEWLSYEDFKICKLYGPYWAKLTKVYQDYLRNYFKGE